MEEIKWKLASKEEPKPGDRVLLKLPDGRCCSGLVTETGGFALEYVDSIDLLSAVFAKEMEWLYLDKK